MCVTERRRVARAARAQQKGRWTAPPQLLTDGVSIPPATVAFADDDVRE